MQWAVHFPAAAHATQAALKGLAECCYYHAGASLVGSSSADDNGHGTHAASSATGAIHGVAKSAIVHSVKVLAADGSGSFSTIIEGLKW